MIREILGRCFAVALLLFVGLILVGGWAVTTIGLFTWPFEPVPFVICVVMLAIYTGTYAFALWCSRWVLRPLERGMT